MDTNVQKAQRDNNDLKIATLYKAKAEHAIDASRYSYLPDFGILGGYVYQDGNAHHLPQDNTNIGFAPRWSIEDAFIGVTIKWNIQDIFSNTYVKRQRHSIKKQAEENLANTLEQVNADIAKVQRKITQSAELISVARKVVDYRREDFKIQNDRFHAGLNLEADYLVAKAALTKAESDLFASQLNYRIVVTDLQILTGKF
jgi:outer membrane protein